MDLKLGIEVVTKATEHDRQDRHKEAIYLYNLALGLLRRALQNEQNENTRKVITDKIKEYELRAQQLTATTGMSNLSLSSNNSTLQTTPNPPPANVPTTHQQTRVEKIQNMVSAPPAIDWTALQQAEKQKWKESEAKEATSGALFTHLENAVKTIEKATEADNQQKYEEAIELYSSALDFFLKAYDTEKNPQIKENIKETMNKYVKRAEKIKQALKEVEASATARERGNSKINVNTLTSSKKEVSPTAAPYVDQAIKAATEATTADECGQVPQAIALYQQALDYFTVSLRNEPKNDIKEMIKDKMVGYTTRLEQLKTFQASGQLSTNVIPLGLKQGEKYNEPKVLEKRSKKEKKTWGKF